MTAIISESEYGLIRRIESGLFELEKKPPFAVLEENNEWDVFDKRDAITDLARGLYHHINEKYQIEEKYDLDESKSEYESPVDLLLILSQIVNAELHGNHYSLNKRTWIKFSVAEFEEGATLEAVIKDEGEGFDWADLVAAEAKARELGISSGYNTFRTNPPAQSVGYALFHTIRYCDSVSWNEKGNEITLRKRLERIK